MKNIFASIVILFLSVVPSLACTVCFGGANNDDLRRGFTWGIIVLGALPYLLLGLFVTYIVVQIRKNKANKKEAV